MRSQSLPGICRRISQRWRFLRHRRMEQAISKDESFYAPIKSSKSSNFFLFNHFKSLPHHNEFRQKSKRPYPRKDWNTMFTCFFFLISFSLKLNLLNDYCCCCLIYPIENSINLLLYWDLSLTNLIFRVFHPRACFQICRFYEAEE